MSEPLAYYNDRLLPQTQAVLPFHDAGLVYGATVADLCRTFRHRLFRLPDHVARFRQSCSLARIPQPVSDERVHAIAEDLVARNARLLGLEKDLALVMLATPGPIGYYAGEAGGASEGSPTLLLHTFPLPFHRMVSLFLQGSHLLVPSNRHVPAACVDPRIKQRSRLHWWLAEQEVHTRQPSASALLLDVDGNVTETATANLLVVRDGIVRTPPRTAVLPGVSLKVVEELSAELGLLFAEESLTLADCFAADEVMLSNTSYCLAGVSRIDNRPIPWPGRIFQQLLRAWSDRVGVSIQGQVEQCARLEMPP